jgi:guanosine-3',5'-bis(diphosphate) 3'-pyrophosphohydrolase
MNLLDGMKQPTELERLVDAIIFATHKHQGQVRKDGNRSPYITHPMAVATAIAEIGRVADTLVLKAAILHDTIEDTDTTEEEIRQSFGEEVLQVVLEVTDDKSLEKMERKRLQVIHAPTLSYSARIIKLADKITNCQDILQTPPQDWTLERRRNYIQWCADVIFQIRGTNAALEDTFDQIISEAEEKLDFQVQPFDTIDQRPWGVNPDTLAKD